MKSLNMTLQKKIEKLIPHDKALHHIWGECNQVGTMLLSFWIIGLWCILLGWIVNFILQWSKEYVIDRHKVTGFSWMDIAYGMSGSIPSSVLGVILYIFTI